MSRRHRPIGFGLAGAAALALVGGALTMAGPASADPGCSVDLSVNQWDTGFTANLTVTNLGDPISGGWNLQWDFAGNQHIDQSWNSRFTQSGQHVTLTNETWNSFIPTSGVVLPGFNASYSGTNQLPTQFTLNGTACTGQTQPPGDGGGDDDNPPSGDSLRDLADQAGLRMGTAVRAGLLNGDPSYANVAADEFNAVTAENEMKWDTIEPSRGNLNFGPADQIVNFAQSHGQQVYGHNLVWHSQIPGWVTGGGFSPDQLRDILHQHITQEVTHFRGDVWAWDVVNEVLNEDGSLRNSIWLQNLGPGYIADAFQWAHEADPNAKLFINDFNLEFGGAKANGMFNLVSQLLSQGVPVDGVGFQAHLLDNPLGSAFAAQLDRFAGLGLLTNVTELDVRMNLPPDSSKLTTQAGVYRDVMNACLARASCVSFTVWGFTDAHSWVPDTFGGQGAACLFDQNLSPKPAYTAVAQALANA